MDLLQAGLPWDRGRRVLVERSVVTCELELLLDADFLIAEDWQGRQMVNQSVETNCQNPYKRLTNHSALRNKQCPDNRHKNKSHSVPW